MNAIRWHQPLPRWARVICVLFGLANLGGAIARASETTFPGILVGAVWALFGWKGLPIIGSTPLDTQQEGVFAVGRRTIRRRRFVAMVVPFVWLLTAGIVLPQVPRQYLPTTFFLSAIPLFFFVFRCVLSECPRCHEHFFVSGNLFRASLTRCVHCGLSLSDTESAPEVRR